jgi:hypothetical protein
VVCQLHKIILCFAAVVNLVFVLTFVFVIFVARFACVIFIVVDGGVVLIVGGDGDFVAMILLFF